MSILGWIILGALAGWIASMIMHTNEEQGAIGNIIVGIIGAFLGGMIFNLLGGQGVTGFNVMSLVVAVIGAVVLLFLIKVLTGGRRTTV